MQSATDVTEHVSEYRAQSGLYGLLGRMLETEVDGALLGLLRGPLREPLAEAGAEIPEDVIAGPDDAVVERLAEEYTALFVQPGAILPYASVFLCGSMFQEPSDRVAKWYAEAGFSYRRRFSGEFPDHLGTMLAFVGALYQRQADAVERGDAALAEETRVIRERFLIEEIGPWACGWSRCARAVAAHPFYERVLALIERVLWGDLGLLVPPRRLRELQVSNHRLPSRLAPSPDYRKASGL